jgi:hypothetical protein
MTSPRERARLAGRVYVPNPFFWDEELTPDEARARFPEAWPTAWWIMRERHPDLNDGEIRALMMHKADFAAELADVFEDKAEQIISEAKEVDHV